MTHKGGECLNSCLVIYRKLGWRLAEWGGMRWRCTACCLMTCSSRQMRHRNSRQMKKAVQDQQDGTAT